LSRGGLKLIGLIPGCGYGNAACEYAAGLDALGYPVSWMPVKGEPAHTISLAKATKDVPELIQQQMCRLWNNHIDAEALLLDVPPLSWHRHCLNAESKLRPYCYVAWEADRLPADWPAVLNRYAGIFVPSRFNERIFRAGGVNSPIRVVPHTVRAFDPGYKNLDLGAVRDEDYVFYTIATWITRKAVEQTVRAYLSAFTSDDPVALVIKTDSVDQAKFWRASASRRHKPDIQCTTAWSLARILAGYPKPAKVHLISKGISPSEIDCLHRRGNCFISLAHSEGWGLGAFDAACAGKPVIMTGWGGQLDYLGYGYPYLVDYSLRRTDQYLDDGCFLHAKDAHWAEARSEHAIELMRRVVEKPAEAHATAAELQARLHKQFAAARVCADLADYMELSENVM
jgi:glycosyltransferase involved in cell wall biosynthesis